MTHTKTCGACRAAKPLTDFHRCAKHGDGLQHRCKLCNIAQRQARLAADARVLLLENARRRAERDGLPFDLTLNDLVVPERCSVLGIALQRHAHASGDSSPTVDRIVPALGYVGARDGRPSNVRVVSMRANLLKRDHSPASIAQANAQRAFDAMGDADALAALVDTFVVEIDLGNMKAAHAPEVNRATVQDDA